MALMCLGIGREGVYQNPLGWCTSGSKVRNAGDVMSWYWA